jgi:hypothetical protein
MEFDPQKIQEAEDAAVKLAILLSVVGLFAGAVIGRASKQPIPTWQVLAFAILLAVASSVWDTARGSTTGHYLRPIIAGLVFGVFLTRRAAKRSGD